MWTKQIKSATESAKAIGRLMSDVRGPGGENRLSLSSVTHSELLYAAPVWTVVEIKTAKNRQTMVSELQEWSWDMPLIYQAVLHEGSLLRIPPAPLLATERLRNKTAVVGLQLGDSCRHRERREKLSPVLVTRKARVYMDTDNFTWL